MTAIDRDKLVKKEETISHRKSFVLLITAILTLAVGIGSFAGGIFAALLAILLYGALFPDPPPLTSREVNDAIAQALASATP